MSYKETVTADSDKVCMSKSPNKHNRIYGMAAPLGDSLANDIENNKVTPKDDPKIRTKYLFDEY